MKLAFSNAAMPELYLNELIEKSRAWGYEGFELTALHGQADLGLIASLADQAVEVRQKLDEAGQQIMAINAGGFVAHAATAREGSKRRVATAIRAAVAVGCSLVVTEAAPAPPGMDKQKLLSSFAVALAPAAREAESAGVTLAIENTGTLAGTHDLWFVRDAVGSPALRVCIDPARSAAAGDSPSTILNRLGPALALIRMSGVDLADSSAEQEEHAPKAGALSPRFIVEILKGLAYRGWLSVSASKNSADADEYFAKAAGLLKSEIDREMVVLTAYKGDKNMPTFSTRTIAT